MTTTRGAMHLLRWARVDATTTELVAPSLIVGCVYTIARYMGNTRTQGQWRLTSSNEDETLWWGRTLRATKSVAQRLEDQRIRAFLREQNERSI